MSEYSAGTKAIQENFVGSDRQQSGLSEGVIVGETDVKGGIWHTIAYTREYGRRIDCYKHLVKILSEKQVLGNQKLLQEKGTIGIENKIQEADRSEAWCVGSGGQLCYCDTVFFELDKRLKGDSEG